MSEIPTGGPTLHRRRLLGGSIAVVAGLAIGMPTTSAQTPTSSVEAGSYGVSYDTGVSWWEGQTTRLIWSDAIVAHDLDAIANQLHAGAVLLFGSDLDRLTAAAEAAAGLGLDVWLQPQLIDGSVADTRAQIVAAATRLEAIRAGGANTTLVTGSSLSVLMQGVLSGATYDERAAALTTAYENDKLPMVATSLNDFLATTVDEVRAVYSGPVTYNAGSWEWEYLDWAPFDLLSASYFRDEDNADSYEDGLVQMKAIGKPVVISEFGSATYDGASELGLSASAIVDWAAVPPVVQGEVVRSETEQADYLLELLDTFEAQQLAGGFVYTFVEEYPTSDVPANDIDMASFGIVKVLPAEQRADETAYWEPKEAFTALAERWGA